ncbi:DNA oxidative demethylase AlkB [Methylovorus menthalis]|uniref:DNA oxidative demethylase AlkB n=1 Tax=Methylovorus menthalis TaxID=1002227 RepID=UPI001E5A8BF5|nr:DNA oxidative demethylase AlkB [Methylovorus menthalis]MCB4810971.1 DNA oxidative demethylase AlkB [Methylovorus menthalis]
MTDSPHISTSQRLFESDAPQALAAATFLLAGFALARQHELLGEIEQVLRESPLRHMQTPGGFTMSVAMSNCGALGWVSDRKGYRYTPMDPLTNAPWPVLPSCMQQLATEAAALCGFAGFMPDACLINRYAPGTRMSLHQDKNEVDYSAPIVSVSLGVDAAFQLGGMQRSDKPLRIGLQHGDVLVWGGEDRLRFHGVLPIKPQHHPLMGPDRINLTFRKAG